MSQKIIVGFFTTVIFLYFFYVNLNYGQIIQTKSNSQNIDNIDYCYFSRILQYGAKGKDVACLQNFLKSQGFFKGKINGIYNKLTKESVYKWQKANKINPANGIFNIQSISFYVKSNIHKLSNRDSQSSIQKFNNDYGILNTQEINAIKISIDNQKGINSLANYMQYVFINTSSTATPSNSKIALLNEQIVNFFKDEPFSLEFMIDKIIEKQQLTSNISNDKLSLFENFFKQRIQILQSITINEKLEKFHKGLIINDLASLKLLKYFRDFLNTQITLEEFKSYYNLYKETITITQKNYLPDINTANALLYNQNAYRNNNHLINFLSNIFDKLSTKKASAQTPLFIPFGGQIIPPPFIFCACSAGRLVFIGPPRPIVLFVPFGFEATPFLYLYKMLFVPGVYTLGLAFPVTIPCLSHALCIPIGAGFLIYIAGTGLVPAPM